MKKVIINIVIIILWSGFAFGQQESTSEDNSYLKCQIDTYTSDYNMIKENLETRLNSYSTYNPSTFDIDRIWNFTPKEEAKIIIESIEYTILQIKLSLVGNSLNSIVGDYSYNDYPGLNSDTNEMLGFNDEEQAHYHSDKLLQQHKIWDTLIYKINLCDYALLKKRQEVKETRGKRAVRVKSNFWCMGL